MKNFRNKSKPTYYDKMYFTKRDVLDIPIAEAIKGFMKDHELHRVLDVGCGTGKMVKFLNENGFDAYGSDVSDIAISMAKKLNGTKKISKASAVKLPFKKGVFDMVISISMIEHITQQQVASFLGESKRLLKSGGYIFLVTPNFESPLRIFQGKHWGGYSDPSHINFYDPTTLAITLKRNGFSQRNLNIGIPYKKSIGINYLSHVHYIPDFLKDEILYLFFSTPLRFMRNSFWIVARNLTTPNCLGCKKPTHPVIEVRLPDKKLYFYSECTSCKLISIWPFPQKIPSKLYKFSDPFVHAVESNPQLNALSRVSGGKKLLKLYIWWCNFLRFRLVSKIKTPGNLLDVGCGEGAFLNLFRNSDWKPSGIEINPHLAKLARETSGARVYTQPIENANLRTAFFDVVTLWHVLEHIPNPKPVLKKIRKAIKPKGFLLLEVPNGQALYRKIFGPHWQLLIPPQHVFLWSSKSLTDQLRRSGFNVLKISYFGIVSFSGASSLANWLRTKGIPSRISIYTAFTFFPFIFFINLLFVNHRENLLIIAQKR